MSGPVPEPGPEPDGPARSVVFFHAHPDDEAIFTGGTMALLAHAGWRVVLVLATAGEQGVTSALVGPDVPLAVRRMGETARAAEELGARRVEFLGYHDSGLGRAEAGPGAFAAAPLGLSTVEVDCTVDVRPVLTVKRRAMAAHASQIPETSSAMRLPDADFAAVYGYEWYARRGPPGPIDGLL